MQLDQPFTATLLQMLWRTEDDTQAFARQWALQLSGAQVIVFLQGNLGAGKTTFTRYLLKALGFKGRVKSPTYTLLETYSLPNKNAIGMRRTTDLTGSASTATYSTDMNATALPQDLILPSSSSKQMLYHFDLYRLQDPQEWEDAGFRDVLASPGIKLVEWPDKAQGLLGSPDVSLQIDLLDDQSRLVRLQAHTEAGQAVLP